MNTASHYASRFLKISSRIRLSAVLVVMFIVGCSSASTALTYYVLHPVDEPLAKPSKEYAYLKLDRFVMPEYLKQRGLVYQTSETNVHISTTHLWAEPLDVGLKKSLKKAISNYGVYLVDDEQYHASKTIHVALHITDFISRFDGEVLLSGEFVVLGSASPPDHIANSIIPFDIRVALKHDGFSASIEAMRESLTQLASQITDNIKVTEKE